jgi:tetratricopeptide (TPR) repeat protein
MTEMVLATASPAMRREFSDEPPEFEFDLPLAAGFIWQGSLRVGEGLVEHEQRQPATPSDRADLLLATAVERATRDSLKYPSSSRTAVNLGLALLAIQKLEPAAAAFDKALELDRRNIAAALYAARTRVLLGRLEEAEVQYLGMLNERPADALVLMHLADLSARKGDLDLAIERWEQVLQLQPNAAIAHGHVGILQAGRGNSNAAIRHLRAATRIEVTSPGFHLGLGIAYALAGSRTKAASNLAAAIHLAPRLAEAHHALAAVLMESQEFEKAEKVLKRRLDQDPNDRRAVELMAEVLYRTQRYRPAARFLQKALEVTDDDAPTDRARLLNNLGVVSSHLNQQNAGRQAYEAALKLRSDYGTARQNLVRALIDSGQPDKAIETLKAGSREFLAEETSRLLLALAYEVSGNYDRAIDGLMRWALDAHAPPIAWATLGQLLTDAKENPEKAIPVLRDAIGKFPDSRLLANNLAYTLLMAGQTDEARRVLESGAAMPVADPIAEAVLHATWGLLHMAEGDVQEGVRGYDLAAASATEIGNESLALTAIQKKHLELARTYVRKQDIGMAKKEVAAGLAAGGVGLYRKHLEVLRDQLRAVR